MQTTLVATMLQSHMRPDVGQLSVELAVLRRVPATLLNVAKSLVFIEDEIERERCYTVIILNICTPSPLVQIEQQPLRGASHHDP